MAGVKVMVIYPTPTDAEAFEKVYRDEHIPMAVEKINGMTKFTATKVLGAVQGTAPFSRIAELYFPSMEALQSSLGMEGAQQTAGHAVSISSGGSPLFLICEEEVNVPL